MPAGKSVVVAGDVCIDWLSIPLDPVSLTHRGAPPYNWQLRGGRRMYARHGGAWLTAYFTNLLAGTGATVYGPQRLEQEAIDSISPDKLIHSLLTLDRCKRAAAGKDFVLGVTEFEGFAGPAATDALMRIPLDPNAPADADVVVLDDAGNGFRDDRSQWPAAVTGDGRTPLVIYKLRRPIGGADLGTLLRVQHGGRTIVLLNVEELRTEADGGISRGLSWERTATETVLALHRTPQLRKLLEFAYLVIPLGLEGVLYVEGRQDAGGFAQLWYCPDLIEADLSAERRGTMTGFASAFAAALAAQLLEVPAAARLTLGNIGKGIEAGMVASFRLYEKGFGLCKKDGPVPAPQYPGREIFAPSESGEVCIDRVRLHPYPKRMKSGELPNVVETDRAREIATRYDRDMADFRGWSIVDSTRTAPYAQLAEQIVRHGVEHVLPHAPVARFGGLELIERREIEAYRTLRNLIREFLSNRKPDRPLCLAVFGAPGSGKSFGVSEVAKALARDNPDAGEIEKFGFNVSQWQSPADLAHALHHVRDCALRENVPLVFFDEFDASSGAEQLAWLKYFLAPMQDGIFNDGASTHIIGRAIFVFAGGTSASFAEFQRKALSDDPKILAAKAPDFLSRLRGYVDVPGIEAPTGLQLLRRALLLRSFLKRKCKRIIDPKTSEARVSGPVLKALLNVSLYRHGVRSIEALLDMSQLKGCTELTASLLPPAAQLELHVPTAEFLRLLNLSFDLGDRLEALARRSHEDYMKSLVGKRSPDHPSMQPWEDLIPLCKNSNREQAADICVKLATVGCDVHPSDDPRPFEFTPDEIESLARLEHERWMKERRPIQPDHPSLVPWEKLPEEEKEKDRRSMRDLAAQLAAAGLEVVRLE